MARGINLAKTTSLELAVALRRGLCGAKYSYSAKLAYLLKDLKALRAKVTRADVFIAIHAFSSLKA